MSDAHEGLSLTLKANFTQVNEAKKATQSLNTAFGELKRRANNLHMSADFPKEINHIDTVTASYIRRLESEGKTYEANQQKVKAYQGAISKLSDEQSKLKSALSQTTSFTDKASDAYRNQKIKLNETTAEVNKFKNGIKEAQSQMEKIHPTGFNSWVQGAKQVDNATGTMKEKLSSAWHSIRGGATVAAAGIGAVGAAAISGAKQSAEVQQRYREINNLAVLGGEKQKEVTKSLMEMQSQGRSMSIKYGKSQQEIAAGYEDLVKRGYTTKQAVGALKSELQASVASGDGFNDVTTVSSQVVDAFGMRANSTAKMLSNTKQVVNELAYSADATSTRFSDLGIAMSYVGTAAKANKISLAETASALGVLSNNGLESDKAGTALRSTINGLTNQVNKIGSKNSIFTKLGIKKSEMLDAHGNLKSLSEDMSVLYKHIQEHSQGGSDQNGFFKSIFGTTGMNGAMILAKSSKELEGLTERTEKAGKTGSYVAKLAAKNMATAQGNTASAQQAMNTFKITLGNAVLPAFNEASNRLSKFLLSKDGEKFQKNVGGAVKKVANAVVNFIKFASAHKGTMEAIGDSLLVGWSVAKAAKFVSFLGSVKRGIDALKGSAAILSDVSAATSGLGGTSKLGGGLAKAGAGRAVLGGTFAKATGIIGTGLEAGTQVFSAVKDRHSADKRSKDIGGAVGAVAGGALTSMIPIVGPLLAPIGATLGKYAGRWGGQAVNNFTKGWQSKKPPKKFWSMENLGWSAKDTFDKFGKGWNDFWGKRGNDMKSFGRSSEKWFSGIGKGFNNGVKGVQTWFKNIPSNIDKTGSAIKSWASKTGNNIHKGWNEGIKASHNFFKNLPENTAKTVSHMQKSWNGFWNNAGNKVKSGGRNIQKNWNSTWKAVNESRYVKAFKRGEFVQTAFHDMKSRWKSFSTSFGKGWNSFWSARSKWAKKSWDGTEQNWNSFWGSMPKKWNSFKKSFGKGWNDFWKSTKLGFDNTIGAITKTWNGFLGSVGKHLSDFGKWAQNSWTGTKNNVKAFGNDINFMVGGSHHKYKYDKMPSHAGGGSMQNNHGALVGEAGPELAYKPYANNARLLGANGPQIAQVHAGEHILNARDTAKILSGGLGNGLVLNGYASGTDKVGNASRKVVGNYKQVANKLGETTKKITGDYKQVADKSSKSLNSLSKHSSSTWNKITHQTGENSSKTRKNAVSDYTDMQKGIIKQMGKTKDGVISLSETTAKGYGKALSKTKGYAHDAMSDSIGEINKGISGIDNVLGQFGGNTSVIKPVKFATGTDANGRLTQNTLAMVNDAQHGPRQESIVTDKNELLIPHGENTILPLKKGWGVLNGTQTQQVAESAGIKHFAKGTGLSHSALRRLAEKALADPAKSFKEMYLANLKQSGPALKRGSIGLAQNSSEHFGNPWSNAMWSVINNAIGGGNGKGGTREAFLRFAESTFSGVPYVMGAMSKAASDCSGMVAQALKHFGIDAGRSTVDMQHSSALQYLGKNLDRTIPGDLVIFGHGTGAAGHVGIVKNPRTGTMFNETPPRARVTRISDDMGMGYGFYRVKGLQNASSSKKTAKPAANLIALAKRELGPSALKWIKDKLGDEGLLGGNIGGEGIQRWAGTVKHILGMLHLSTSSAMVARVLRQISTESGGNPHARQPGTDPDGDGSGPALGLMQTKRATFEAYKRKGDTGGIFNGPSDIYAGLNYAKHRYGPGLSFLGNGHGYAKGGNPKAHVPFVAGERGPELITADGPVKVDSHEQTKRKVSDLSHLFQTSKINRPTRSQSSAPVINININGPIYGSEAGIKQLVRMMKEQVQIELSKVLVNIGDEYGTHPSLF